MGEFLSLFLSLLASATRLRDDGSRLSWNKNGIATFLTNADKNIADNASAIPER